MGDDYHKPTYTFPKNTYNATQVRLYGIPASTWFAFQNNNVVAELKDATLTVAVDPSADPKILENSNKALGILKDREKQDAGAIYSAMQELSGLWPVPLPTKIVTHLAINTKTLGNIILATTIGLKDAFEHQPMSAGIIFGYAYEGHCYDLAKPKIMIIPAMYRPIPPDDSGYKEKEPEPAGYRVWIVDKLDECIEIDINQGFIEQLVLEANLPGRRSPTMYAGKMMTAHRSGRLTE